MKIRIDLTPEGHVSVEIDSQEVVNTYELAEKKEELLKDAGDFLAAADKVKESEKTYVGDGITLAPIKKKAPMSEQARKNISEGMKKKRIERAGGVYVPAKVPTPKPWANENIAFTGVPTFKCGECNRIYTWQQKKLSPRCGQCGCEEYTVVEDE